MDEPDGEVIARSSQSVDLAAAAGHALLHAAHVGGQVISELGTEPVDSAGPMRPVPVR